jgi:hypothetical protein
MRGDWMHRLRRTTRKRSRTGALVKRWNLTVRWRFERHVSDIFLQRASSSICSGSVRRGSSSSKTTIGGCTALRSRCSRRILLSSPSPGRDEIS